MSAQHTQGKLKVFSTYAIPEIRDQEDHFVFAAGSASPQSFVNARRLVACWNACEGIGTDFLENIAMTGDTLASRFKARDEAERELAAQRDELLAALKSFLRAPSIGSGGPGSLTIVVQDFNLRAAQAAIAKAEGSTK